MSLTVEIVTPSKKAFEGTADQVQAPAWLGEMGVLPRHAAVLTLTRAGVVTLHAASGQLLIDREPVNVQGTRRLVVGPGFAEVGPDRVTMVVELCEDGNGVDKAAAAEALKKAEHEMAHTDGRSLSFRLAQKTADLARARLAV